MSEVDAARFVDSLYPQDYEALGKAALMPEGTDDMTIRGKGLSRILAELHKLPRSNRWSLTDEQLTEIDEIQQQHRERAIEDDK